MRNTAEAGRVFEMTEAEELETIETKLGGEWWVLGNWYFTNSRFQANLIFIVSSTVSPCLAIRRLSCWLISKTELNYGRLDALCLLTKRSSEYEAQWALTTFCASQSLLPDDLEISEYQPLRHFLFWQRWTLPLQLCRRASKARSRYIRLAHKWPRWSRRQLTHILHLPLLCRRRSVQQRIPYPSSVNLLETISEFDALTVSTWPGSISITRIFVAMSSFRSASVKVYQPYRS